MKQFRYAAGLAALAMLGACSTEAPEPVNGGSEDGGMFITVNFTGAQGTRDGKQTTVDAIEGDTDIDNMQLVIYDELENVYLCTSSTKIDDATKTAYFQVEAGSWQDMEAKASRNAQMKIVLYANGGSLSGQKQDVLHTTRGDATWGIQTREGINATGFVMSNNAECQASFVAHDAAHDGTADNKNKAWAILGETKIELARLATRFDYGTNNQTSYDLQAQAGITMSIVGYDVETHARDTYCVATFSPNGKIEKNADGTFKTHTHYSADTNNPFRVTSSAISSDLKSYNNHNYTFLNSTNKSTFMRPNTVSTDYTFLGTKEDYKKLPYTVVKAKFECTNFAGATETQSAELAKGSISMKNGETVFAVNGVFMGGLSDWKEMKAKGLTFKAPAVGTLTPAEQADVKDAVDAYNNSLTHELPSTYDSSKDDDDDEAWLVGLLVNPDKYEADKKTGEYYTYYSALIVHDSTATEVKDGKTVPVVSNYYGVSRNTAYILAVESFKFLGAIGSKHPGDGPEESDFTKLYINLSITVADWAVNNENDGLKL